LAFIRQMKGLGFRLREVSQLVDLRDHQREACHEIRDLLKAKLKEIRSKIRHLEELERELTFDLQKCKRELSAGNKKQAARSCPRLGVGNSSNGKGLRS